MTIVKFQKKVTAMDNKFQTSNGQLFSEVMLNSMDIWSNNACLGYLQYAMNDLEFDNDTKIKLINAMKYAFDMMTVDEAEKRAEKAAVLEEPLLREKYDIIK